MLHLFHLTVDTKMNVVTNVTVVQCSTVEVLVSDWEFEKVVVTRTGRLREGALVSDRKVKQ